MIPLSELVNYLNDQLRIDRFADYCPNGLQVEACATVARVLTGVTASGALIEQAKAIRADVLLVHHGYFWEHEPAPLTGFKGRRIAELFRAGISLAAYHLPLDAHPLWGNNAQLGQRLGIVHAAPVSSRDDELMWQGLLPEPLTAGAFAVQVAQALGRPPLLLEGGPQTIQRLAWCSGAAQSGSERAVALGVDAYLSGEASEPQYHWARETGIHYFAAGHHATERYGVMALGEHLRERFGLDVMFQDEPNPL